MPCTGKMNCKCRHCTSLPEPAASSSRGSGRYGGQQAALSQEQKTAIAERAKAIIKSLTGTDEEKATQLVRMKEKVLGETGPIRYKRDAAQAAKDIAKAEVLKRTKQLPQLSNGAVATMANLLGAQRPSIMDMRELLTEVAKAEAKKGPISVDLKKGMSDGATKTAAILESAMFTYNTRRDQCDAFSVYNPILQKASPAEVETKRLECGANTDGTCTAQSGKGLYPFACVPSFEACMAGDAEACAVVATQLKAGTVEELKEADASLPKTVLKADSDGAKLLEAWNKIWGKNSPYALETTQMAYDMLIVSLLMDLDTFKTEKKEAMQRYGVPFEAHNRKLVDIIWRDVQVPIIKMINNAEKDPSSYRSAIDRMIGQRKYAAYVNANASQLEALMFQLRDSTDLMKRWLGHPSFKYVVGDEVNLTDKETVVFLLGIYLIKKKMGIVS